jgi:hypothetical protein
LDPTSNVDGNWFRNPCEVEDLLRMEVKIADLERKNADLSFWRASANVRSLSHNQDVALAAIVQSVARRSLLNAVVRLNAFLTYGTVPDDLRFRPPGADKHNAQAA